MDFNTLTAEMLESSAAGYASAASAAVAQTSLGASYAVKAPAEWKAHLTQRILELAAAIRVNEPSLFAHRITWLRSAIKARGADESELRCAIESLGTALDRELPEELKPIAARPIQLALLALDAEAEPEARSFDAATMHGQLGLRYLAACLEARTEAAVKLVLEALDENPPQAIYTKVLLPAQREIGLLWHSSDVSVAEERIVSETTRDLMALIVNKFAPVADEKRTVVAAAVAGNAHDIGLRAASDLFKLAGWHSIFLGADMPTAEIAEAARTYHAKLVVLSATLTTQLGTLAEAVQTVRQVAGAAKIIVGGLALDEHPEFWKRFGADGYARDIDSVVAVGSALVGHS